MNPEPWVPHPESRVASADCVAFRLKAEATASQSRTPNSESRTR
jgi:hypothetical protein